METQKTSFDRRTVAGGLLVLAGVILLLDSFNIIPFDLRHYLISWKTFLIFIGLIIISNRENKTTGWVFISLGIMFWLPEFFDYRFHWKSIFWPAVLIGVGLIIITRKSGPSKVEGSKFSQTFRGSRTPHTNEQDYIDETAIFGGGNTVFTSNNFKGGRITAIFGGSDLLMTQSTPSAEGCVIDTFVMFGGTNLVVPDDWQIKSEVVAIFGGFSDKRILPAVNNPDKLVIIKGVVLFGGVEIKSY